LRYGEKMNVEAVSGITADPTPGTRATRSGSLDYDAFLHLLIAQMKNQDPTEPVQSTEYLAQLAAFSNVEQALLANSKLDAIMTALSLSQADGLIGRYITSADGTVEGEVKALQVTSAGAVAILTDGREVVLGAGVIVK